MLLGDCQVLSLIWVKELAGVSDLELLLLKGLDFIRLL